MSKLLVSAKDSGNTYTVCDYVEKNTEIDLKIANEEGELELEKYKTIILCSGVYGGRPHKSLLKWIENLNEEQITDDTKFYMFMTWFGRGNSDRTAMKKVDAELNKIGAELQDDYITCYGENFVIIQKGHPNEKDCKKVLDWVEGLG